MSPENFSEMPLDEAAFAIRDGSLPATRYLDSWLDTIERVEPRINALIGFERDSAQTSMPEASSRGRLAGIPVAAKDNIVTKSSPTTCGSRMLPRFISPFDATAIARLETNGARVIAKANLDEFAMGSSTEHSAFGVCRNPWDLDRVAGGSSGGSAAAVAARMVPVALGSETGGSVRQPAAFCGVTGLKPTWGRVSRWGLVAFASSLDQIGIVGRTAADCALVLETIAGADPADSTASLEPVPAYSAGLGSGIGGLRFGVVQEAIDSLEGETRENFENASTLLRREGATVERVSVPSIRYAIAMYYVIANAEASANLARFDGVRYGHRSEAAATLQQLYVRSRTEGFGAEVKRRIMLGTFALSSGYYDAYYGRAQKARALLRRDFERAFSSCDYLLTPTTPGPAFRVGEKADDPLAMYLSDIFTAPANLVGIPAIAVPSGFSGDGLPLSLQIMGRHFSEGGLLNVADHYEKITGWGRAAVFRVTNDE
ncbi:MAG TPA: Asp-tRNA(Asn)/Glu-tRNA(Gln) amidotransferase subunit GatA [Thermoanaerobaculia bacterium]|nr:Asp-tRNA(Asn)/Glu-tRNA(Gln) amidotransferase subunit GatA [Thermoanaerobaculia bacterium]